MWDLMGYGAQDQERAPYACEDWGHPLTFCMFWRVSDCVTRVGSERRECGHLPRPEGSTSG